MKCLNCSKEFEAKRKTAKFCSSKCRVYFSRTGISVVVPTMTEIPAKELKPQTPVPIPESLGGPPDPNVRWDKLCEHFAALKFCKIKGCKNYQFK